MTTRRITAGYESSDDDSDDYNEDDEYAYCHGEYRHCPPRVRYIVDDTPKAKGESEAKVKKTSKLSPMKRPKDLLTLELNSTKTIPDLYKIVDDTPNKIEKQKIESSDEMNSLLYQML